MDVFSRSSRFLWLDNYYDVCVMIWYIGLGSLKTIRVALDVGLI